MTSTKYNVGLGDSNRNSSRVLRPPGGGHTDIFGAELPQAKKDTGRNASSILEGTNSNVIPPSPNKPSTAPSKNANEPVAPQQAQRTRVPPGGFSSGYGE